MPSPRPEPEVPTFVDGQIVQQSDLQALAEHAALLFGWLQGGFRSQKPLLELRATTGVLTNAPAFTLWQQVGVNSDFMYGSIVTPSVFINTPGIYLIDC